MYIFCKISKERFLFLLSLFSSFCPSLEIPVARVTPACRPRKSFSFSHCVGHAHAGARHQHVIHDRRAQSRWLLVSMYQETRKCSQVDLRASRSLNVSLSHLCEEEVVRESCQTKRRSIDLSMTD